MMSPLLVAAVRAMPPGAAEGQGLRLRVIDPAPAPAPLWRGPAYAAAQG
jgi:hypothetical protein